MGLPLKALLWKIRIEPPKWHDVSALLTQYRVRLPNLVQDRVDRLAEISRWLRAERELAFCGAEDVIPTRRYGEAEARRAISDASFVFETACLM